MTWSAAARMQPRPASAIRVAHAAPDAQRIVSRLAAEFPAVDRQTVDRQVRDSWNCAVHLSADVTPEVVEELAREHLTALEGSLELIRPVQSRGRRHPVAL